MSFTKIDKNVEYLARQKYLLCNGKKRTLTYHRTISIYLELCTRAKYSDTKQVINNVLMKKGFCLLSLKWFEEFFGIPYEEVRKIIKFLESINAIECIKKGTKDRKQSVYLVVALAKEE